jgi:hypothetical protein
MKSYRSPAGLSHWMTPLCYAIIACAVPGCATMPPAQVERPVTSVSASFGRTWDAVIDAFAAKNIPIKTMERASGFISADAASVFPVDAAGWADCGKALGVRFFANRASYNVTVRGDSTRSTVRVTATWSANSTQCTSTGVWESERESDVRSRAERPR